jgi:hypothetical protein
MAGGLALVGQADAWGLLLHRHDGQRTNRARQAYSWKMLVSGYAPAYVCEIGGRDTRLSLADVKPRSHINTRAQAADEAPDCSWCGFK